MDNASPFVTSRDTAAAAPSRRLARATASLFGLTRPEMASDDHPLVHASDLARILVVAIGAVVVWFRVWEPLGHISVPGIGFTVVGAWPILHEAVANLRARRMTMELSMSLAIVAALVVGEVFTALVILLFVLVAEVLEHMTVERGRHAIHHLLGLLPQQALVRRGDTHVEVPVEQVRPGDAVLVRPGGRVPVDGHVVDGLSFVDESPITGESLPVEKTPGAHVFAGTINQSGAMEIAVERVGADTSFGQIVSAVEQAERSRAPIQKTADRLAGYLVYFALGAAVLTLLLTRDVRATISVIIVAGACGVAAGTPLAILGGIGQAARRGAIVKGGLYFEQLAAIDTMVFDKTGTLTLGQAEVRRVDSADRVTRAAVLAAAALAETRSEHPLARAIVACARAEEVAIGSPDRFSYTPGLGVVAFAGGVPVLVGGLGLMAAHEIIVPTPWHASHEGSQVLVAKGGRLLGRIVIADAVRPEARRALDALRAMGISTLMLSGDAPNIAAAVAADVGVDAFAGGLLPSDKLARLEALGRAGHIVAMVGDGINDAPSLARAHVGIAMGSGTDVARESAPVVLLGNDLSKLVDTVRVARHTRRIIWQNFAGTIAVDGVGIALAAAGLLDPLLAAFIHVSSELLFIGNSARLLPGRLVTPPARPGTA